MKERHLFLLGFGTLVGMVLVGLFLGGTTDGPDEGADAVRSHPLIAAVRPHLASAKSAPVDKPRPQAADDAEPPESEQEPVFEVGGRTFRSLAEAVEAAEPGETITLNGDAYVRKPVVVGENAGEMAGTSAYGGVYDNKPTPEQVPEGKVVVDNGDGIYSVADATVGN